MIVVIRVADVINHLAFGFEMARRSGLREDWDPKWQPDSTAPTLEGVPAAEWASVCGREAPRTAQAWSDPAAWEGESAMGSSAMPASGDSPVDHRNARGFRGFSAQKPASFR
ncbi:MAG: hypothetical protein WKF51_12670 [Geodermatophilaceae bacterium]